MNHASPHILIVNQHGENRGDEAAMRAMVNAFVKRLNGVSFTLLYQFRSGDVKPQFDENVNCLPMVMPFHKAVALSVYALCRTVKLSLPFILDAATKQIIHAYDKADLIISAPGGPYLGDIYYKHEIVHWFFIWLSGIYRKPVMLYAPSVGPFRIKPLNMIRKRLFKRFNVVCVREKISKEYIDQLCRKHIDVYVTADSALQRSFPAFERHEYFQDDRAQLAGRFLVGVSAIQYSFPGKSNVREMQDHYVGALLECLIHLGKKRDCHFLFFPQLYGSFHSDVPFLNEIGSKLPPVLSWEIVDNTLDSDMQQRLFAMTDLCIASRYHPQIFAASAGVPGICIYYEHKAFGFMDMIGMKDLAFDIRNLESKEVCSKLDEILERRDELSAIMKERIFPLREKAGQTTTLAVNLLTDLRR